MRALLAPVSEDWLKTWPVNHTQHSTPSPSLLRVSGMFESIRKITVDRRPCLPVNKLRAEKSTDRIKLC